MAGIDVVVTVRGEALVAEVILVHGAALPWRVRLREYATGELLPTIRMFPPHMREQAIEYAYATA